jgi:hypothetical protein
MDEFKESYASLWKYYAHSALGFRRFLQDCVYTQDEEARPELGEEIKKKFPYHKKYVQVLADQFLIERLIVLPKSRRMIATWLVAAYAVWYAMFNDRRNILWQAQTEKKSAHTLEEKMLYIMQHIPYSLMCPWVDRNRGRPPEGFPPELLNYYRPARDKSGLIEICFQKYEALDTGEERLTDNSTIYAIAEGSHQWRQYTVSLGICDEFAFFANAADSIKGARPAVGLKGQLILVSSANHGYMAQMVERTDKEPVEQLMEGVRKWRSKQGYAIIELHYTADEEKRGIEWTEPFGKSERSGIARMGYDEAQWKQEMEIDFTIFTGQPFYPEFKKQLHVHPVQAIPDLPFILGFDFGLTPSTAICQVDPKGIILVLDEFTSENNGIEQHTDDLIYYMKSKYPWFKVKSRNDERDTAPVISYVDPAGAQRSQIDLTSAVDVLRRKGLNPYSSVQNPVERMEATKGYLTKFIPSPYDSSRVMPIILFDPKAKKLIEGMMGGCKISSSMRWRKEKNEYSHIVEALEYILVAFGAVVKRQTNQIGSKPIAAPHWQRSAR